LFQCYVDTEIVMTNKCIRFGCVAGFALIWFGRKKKRKITQTQLPKNAMVLP